MIGRKFTLPCFERIMFIQPTEITRLVNWLYIGIGFAYYRVKHERRSENMKRTLRSDARTPGSLWIMGSILIFVLSIMPSSAFAITCEIDDARNNLRRAANETDLEAAKDFARRASGYLDDAAMCAKDDCRTAFMEFYNAAIYANWARHANSPQEFVDSLNRAIRAFNTGIEALQSWARKASR